MIKNKANKTIINISIKVTLIIICNLFIVPKTYQTLNKITKEEIITISLIGNKNVILNVDEKYLENGVEIYINDQKTDSDYEVHGKVNIQKPGTYEIIYKIKNITEKRIITVIDNIPPTITLNGDQETTIFKGDTYLELGFSAHDNIDGDITKNVVVTGTVNPLKIGKYIITYNVTDSNNNKYEVQRIINVKEKIEVNHINNEIKDPDKKPKSSYNNEIISMSFYTKGIKIEGHHNSSKNDIKIINKNNKEEKIYNTTTNKNIYTATLDLSTLSNGTYELYITNNITEKIINKLDDTLRIVRSKIGNKLVTVSYTNNNITINIKDFSYQYDILIDVGHGGTDNGASNNYIKEKELNLIVSNYEKNRYEQHGLKVLLSRTDDSYGLLAGNTDWIPVRRRAYAVGYYGVVSKIVYSNHHNSSPNKNYTGWEILVPSSLTKAELASEHKIVESWNKFYILKDNHTRFYTRNYDNDAIYDKINGEVYTFNDYYALNRIPYNLFNVKSVIFEGTYMSNVNDFKWYYLEGNWKKVSEAKIKVYVETLGKTYVPPVY